MSLPTIGGLPCHCEEGAPIPSPGERGDRKAVGVERHDLIDFGKSLQPSVYPSFARIPHPSRLAPRHLPPGGRYPLTLGMTRKGCFGCWGRHRVGFRLSCATQGLPRVGDQKTYLSSRNVGLRPLAAAVAPAVFGRTNRPFDGRREVP